MNAETDEPLASNLWYLKYERTQLTKATLLGYLRDTDCVDAMVAFVSNEDGLNSFAVIVRYEQPIIPDNELWLFEENPYIAQAITETDTELFMELHSIDPEYAIYNKYPPSDAEQENEDTLNPQIPLADLNLNPDPNLNPNQLPYQLPYQLEKDDFQMQLEKGSVFSGRSSQRIRKDGPRKTRNEIFIEEHLSSKGYQSKRPPNDEKKSQDNLSIKEQKPKLKTIRDGALLSRHSSLLGKRNRNNDGHEDDDGNDDENEENISTVSLPQKKQFTSRGERQVQIKTPDLPPALTNNKSNKNKKTKEEKRIENVIENGFVIRDPLQLVVLHGIINWRELDRLEKFKKKWLKLSADSERDEPEMSQTESLRMIDKYLKKTKS